jgi:hypothetical protein
MSQFQPHWISDPGHAWLVIPMRDLVASGFEPSPFSFISDDGLLAYLEEDSDAPGYLKAAGVPGPTLVVNIRQTWARPLRHFEGGAQEP